MPDAERFPRILLAFIIFLSQRRGGGFVVIDLTVVGASQQQRRRIHHCVDRDSSIQDNLTKCSAHLDERHTNAALGSYPAHAALCICAETDLSIPQTSYVAITAATESDHTVQFSSPTNEAQTDTKALAYIYQQLVKHDGSTPVSRIELVDLKSDLSWFHRLSSKPLPRPEFDNFLSLFQKRAQEHAEDSAIEAWDKDLTYSELDSASTATAAALCKLGVKRGDNVVLALNWSSWAPICALATFKAGAAFAFRSPQDKILSVNWCVEAVEGQIVLCDASDLGRLSTCSTQVVSVQSLQIDPSASPLKYQQQELQAADLAYILFTSGSTGKPKTVLTSQQALAAGAEQQARALGMSERSRVLGDGTPQFAGCLPKLLFTFAVGACLCVPQPSQDIVEAANQYRTNCMVITVAATNHIDPSQFAVRHSVCLGSEVVPESVAALWGRTHDLRVAYGASEVNCVFSGGPWESAISNRDVGGSEVHRCWIVDPADHGRLMPPGWPGEVLVQSVAMAHGYQNNEAETAKAFPSAPSWYFSAVKPQSSTPFAFGEPCDLPVRWYRTGDFGRLDPSTLSLEILGRIDQLQLALPGGSVDVAMLEAAAQPALKSPLTIAVQLGLPRGDSVPRVVAFLSDESEGSVPQVRLLESGVVEDAALREALRNSWREGGHSVGPEYVLFVKCLPRLHSAGKIQRKALRDWIGEQTTKQLATWRL